MKNPSFIKSPNIKYIYNTFLKLPYNLFFNLSHKAKSK